MKQTIRVGDDIIVRSDWGFGKPQKARVIDMEVTKYPRQKDGEPALEVPITLVRENRVVFTVRYAGSRYDNWCYANQVNLGHDFTN